MPAPDSRLLMDPAAVADGIRRLAARILEADEDTASAAPLVLIGIHKRGVPLARRIAAVIREISDRDIPAGTLDITQYRDDLGTIQDLPALVGSDIPFDIDEARVILCDEVIYSGRSIRAALSELLDFGRPARVQLAVLVDRAGREFPIQPDYAATTVSIPANERVSVQFTEVDPEDAVYIEPARTSP